MKDAEYEKQRDRIRALADKWLEPLGLLMWRRVHLAFSDDVKAGSPECVGEARVSWEYQEATITFYLPNVVGLDDEDLEYAFVHECQHVLVHEMRWQDADTDNIRHEERVCTTLARAFVWVKDHAKSGKL